MTNQGVTVLHQEVSYTLKQVAKILNCSHQLVRRLILNGKLKAYKLERDWRIKESELRNYMERASNEVV